MGESIDLQAVTSAIDQAVERLVLPRFSRLAAHEIEAKGNPEDPEDVVTVVDNEVEAFLSEALSVIDPAAAVVGEESVYQRPGLLDLVATDRPLWIVDPIDGTKNFAAGSNDFGIMVSYVVDGHAKAAWVVLPARRQTFVAQADRGTSLNGQPITVRPGASRAKASGVVLVRYMPGGLGKRVAKALDGRVQLSPLTGCAAVDYTNVVLGASDFAVYYRLFPWDHAAPALVLTEAGGCVRHLRGQSYTVRSADQLTIVARNADVANQLLGWLAPLE